MNEQFEYMSYDTEWLMTQIRQVLDGQLGNVELDPKTQDVLRKGIFALRIAHVYLDNIEQLVNGHITKDELHHMITLQLSSLQ